MKPPVIIDLPAVRARVLRKAERERRMFPGIPLPVDVQDALDLLALVDELTEAGRLEQAATAATLRGKRIDRLEDEDDGELDAAGERGGVA